MWYSYKQDSSHMSYAISTEKVKEIIQINKQNKLISALEEYAAINQGKNEENSYSKQN